MATFVQCLLFIAAEVVVVDVDVIVVFLHCVCVTTSEPPHFADWLLVADLLRVFFRLN